MVLTRKQNHCANKTGYPKCLLAGTCAFVASPPESEAFEACMAQFGQDTFGKPLTSDATKTGSRTFVKSPQFKFLMMIVAVIIGAFLITKFMPKKV